MSLATYTGLFCRHFGQLAGYPDGEGDAEEAGGHIGYGLGEHDAFQTEE